MKINIGLDIGGSTTKVVGFRDHQLLMLTMVKASDPVASTYGGIGKFLSVNQLALPDVEKVYITGVGSSCVNKDVLGLETIRVDEFQAVGLGGLYLSGLEEAIVVSMGTGTSLVHARKDRSRHIIGSGVGGGTLLGLSKAILGISDHSLLAELAEDGSLANIDLSVQDLSACPIEGLDPDTTASNFGKMGDKPSQEDLALGIVNLVFQSIGTNAILAAQLRKLEDIVFVGSLAKLSAGQACLRGFSSLYSKNIIIPQDVEYATAIGAALSGITDKDHRWTIED